MHTLVVCKPQLPPAYTAQAKLWPAPPPGVLVQHCPMLALHPLPQALQALHTWVHAPGIALSPAEYAGRQNLFKVAVFVSPSVLEFALSGIGSWPADIFCAVMGQQSAALAQYLGVPVANIVAPGPSSHTAEDAEGLLQCLQQRFAKKTTDVVLCHGTNGRADLAPRLAIWAKQFAAHVCYTQQPLQHTPTLYHDLLRHPGGKALWATSSAALSLLCGHLHHANALAFSQFQAEVSVLATHPNIAQRATGLGFGRVHLLATGIQSAYAWLQHNKPMV
jgi:uroporphyrinogen-III synthase